MDTDTFLLLHAKELIKYAVDTFRNTRFSKGFDGDTFEEGIRIVDSAFDDILNDLDND